MNYVTIFLVFSLVMVSSCSELRYCSCDSIESNEFTYEILEKEKVHDGLYKGIILVQNEGYENLMNSSFYYDSLICFCLAVCEKESMPIANFVSLSEGVTIIKEYSIEYISPEQLSNAGVYIRRFSESPFIGSVSIKRLNNWKKHLNSKNFNELEVILGPIDDKNYHKRVLVHCQ